MQVVRYENRQVKILRHIGSAKTADELRALRESAEVVANDIRAQLPLFDPEPRTLAIEYVTYLGSLHRFAYRVLLALMQRAGFAAAVGPIATDLAVIRIVEPASKRRSLILLDQYFGVLHAERSLYRELKTLVAHKDAVEQCALRLAQSAHDLSIVLYDVTTLYFETHADDDAMRSRGFSKDNKSQQPQIVVGLLVDCVGAPLGYEVFPGKTFEGHTMLPLLDAFAARQGIAVKTIVADAAMLSRENLQKLEDGGYTYIVGARLANLPGPLRRQFAEIPRKHGAMRRYPTDRGDIIVAFSEHRYRKDHGDMNRQWKRAAEMVARGESGRRPKFVSKNGGTSVLNAALREKTEALLGLKGYHTNIPEDALASEQVVARYHDLWQIEQAFRVAKSDLATRPIFHRQEDSIRAHMLICFMALSVAHAIEQATGESIRTVRDELMRITDARIVDQSTGRTITLSMPLTSLAKQIVRQLGVSY